jgi:hypothetical protein
MEDAVVPPATIAPALRPTPIMAPSSHPHPAAPPRVVFGQVLPRHSASNRPTPAHAQQHDLFATQAPATLSPAQQAQTHDLADERELSQRSLFD